MHWQARDHVLEAPSNPAMSVPVSMMPAEFGAKIEAMTAEQRRLFEQTLVEDETSLQAQLDALPGTRTWAALTSAGHGRSVRSMMARQIRSTS